MRVAVLLSLLLLPAFAGQATAQERVCTEIGCVDGLMLTSDPSYKWKWGFYEIDLAFDGRNVTCKGKLPLKPCDEGPSFRCSSDKVIIGESGCALPDAAHGISTIQINDTPRRVIVNVQRGGKSVILRTLSPDYQETRPNGPGCGPVCTAAAYNLQTTN